MTTLPKVDKILLVSIVLLTVAGLFIFFSASTGLLASSSGAQFSSVVINQFVLGLIPGLVSMYLLSRLNYHRLRKWAVPIFIAAFVLTLLVFVPHIGFESGGAKRWLAFGTHTFQPSEFLKLAVIIYFAAWLASVKEKAETFKWGTAPFLVLMALTGALLVAEPDIDTFLVIFASCFCMLFVAGMKLRHFLILILLGTVLVGVMAFAKPYVFSRLVTYFNPQSDSLGSSYQIQQSLIAVGSGKVFGRGFGQSIQKFNYLPEAIGDSIFAVAGEEFGFVGSSLLILFFLFFGSRALRDASRSSDAFGKYLLVGFVTVMLSQSFVNIGAMINILPLSGIPLVFVSHGGTALLFTLAEAGIMLNVSRYSRV